MGILAIGEGVVEGNADGLPVDLQSHRLSGDARHRCRRCGCQASVVVGITQHGITVVVIHVTTDAFADGWSERIGGHGKDAGMERTKSAEALPEQEGQSKTTEPHVSGQHDEQPDGERVTNSVCQRLMEAQPILSRKSCFDRASVAER